MSSSTCPWEAPTQGLAESGQWLPSYTSISASSAQRDRCGLLGHNSLCWSRDNTLKKPGTVEPYLVIFSSLRDHCLLLHAAQCLKAVASHIFCPILWLKQQGESCINYSVIAGSGSLPWSRWTSHRHSKPQRGLKEGRTCQQRMGGPVRSPASSLNMFLWSSENCSVILSCAWHRENILPRKGLDCVPSKHRLKETVSTSRF